MTVWQDKRTWKIFSMSVWWIFLKCKTKKIQKNWFFQSIQAKPIFKKCFCTKVLRWFFLNLQCLFIIHLCLLIIFLWKKLIIFITLLNVPSPKFFLNWTYLVLFYLNQKNHKACYKHFFLRDEPWWKKILKIAKVTA